MGILSFSFSSFWIIKFQIEGEESYSRKVKGSKKSIISAAKKRATEVVVNDTESGGFTIECIVKGKKVTMEHSLCC